jgi:hypothetical protein
MTLAQRDEVAHGTGHGVVQSQSAISHDVAAYRPDRL